MSVCKYNDTINYNENKKNDMIISTIIFMSLIIITITSRNDNNDNNDILANSSVIDYLSYFSMHVYAHLHTIITSSINKLMLVNLL